MAHISLISWNVNGIRAAHRKGLIDFIQKTKADAFCFQEIKADVQSVPEDVMNLEGYEKFFHSAKKKGYSGTAILTKLKPINVVYGIGDEIFDDEGRVITLEFEDFFLVNAYFPNSQHDLKRLDFKIKFDREIQEYLNKLKAKKDVVLCGDFNVAHKEIDIANPKQNEGNAGFTPEERNWMSKFLSDGYVDTFRMFTKDGGHYTWWTYRFKARERNIGWRIDYFVVNEKMKEKVKRSVILSDVLGSDHAPIQLEMEI
ncbi:exodeoxyribonuclease III [Mesoaciditoga lauensis]|uniref:exodeoxyribonuclease III n=1 Tax=Mesoaciditoga lauensis TaxID=1495039 RepID=UPI0005649A33|nr:exodeoxyribonuclease III [Mesoaciditoga lauensis]